MRVRGVGLEVSNNSRLFCCTHSWQEAVEVCYALRISDPPSIEKYADKEAMRQLSCPPPKWSLDADEELAKFMADHVNKQEASLGNISRYVESVQVSSVSCLFVMLKTCQVFLPVLK